MSLAGFLLREWFSAFFLFLPLILLSNITTTLISCKLHHAPKWRQIAQAEKAVPALVGIYLAIFLIIYLYVLDVASVDIWQSNVARKAFEVLLVIVVLNPDIFPAWIPMYHIYPTRRDVTAFLGCALVRLAYPALAKAWIVNTASVYALVGLALHVLLWKFVEKELKRVVKSVGGKKKGNVAFTIDESDRYYRDFLYAAEREETEHKRGVGRGRRSMGSDPAEEEEEVADHVSYAEELMREGVEYLDGSRPVPDSSYRRSNGK
jgi:hypothetical protein